MINLVIPMAGQGSRFANVGYKLPKPFIDVAGKPMITRVLDNLFTKDMRAILLARSEHLQAYPEHKKAIVDNYNVEFITVDKLTEGAVCTVLHAHRLFNNDDELIIANSDQIVDFDINDFIADARKRKLDGSILVFPEPGRDPKWSYALPSPDGIVTEVKEKQPISDLATVGIYYYKRGRDFVNGALDMIVRNERYNNEFYVCPVYNDIIAAGAKIGVYEVPANKMHGIGTPDDLNTYLAHIGYDAAASAKA